MPKTTMYVKGQFIAPDGKIWTVDTRRANWKYPSHKALRWYIYEKSNYKCCHCGRQAVQKQRWQGESALLTSDGLSLDIDHILPVAHGGRFTPSNLQLLCSVCNSKKGGRHEMV